jgi:glutathione S-transferase
MSDVTLITFPPSLDSELARFLLHHYRVQHREQRHTLIFSCFATVAHGFTPLFPLLYSDSYRLSPVRQIVDHFDPICPTERKLLPSNADRDKLEADWSLFNDTLAFASAIFAYYHLLPHKEIMLRPLSEGTPDFEVRAVENAYPVFAGLLRVLLLLTPSRAEEALGRARKVMSEVDARIADGRRYLVGNRFSLSDMAFAVAAAPLVLPDTYGGPLPSFDQMPGNVQAVIREMRQQPAGQFALRIYREHRTDAAVSVRKVAVA